MANPVEAAGFSKPRVGPELPLSCPRHRTSTLAVTTATDFPTIENWHNSLCCAPCTKVLNCGHLCAEKCHSPEFKPHTTSCEVLLPRPCERHADVPLRCCQISLDGKETAEAHLLSPRFQCKEAVNHLRAECGHSVRVECYQLNKPNGPVLPACTESVADFYHPKCNHVYKNLDCTKRRAYESKAPECRKKVVHTRPCGCNVAMECRTAVEEEEHPVNCTNEINAERPRCHHTLSMRCHQASKLRQSWEAHGGLAICDVEGGGGEEEDSRRVEHGVLYGPPESTILPAIPDCKAMVTYHPSCGHTQEKVRCHKAFRFASGAEMAPECCALTTFPCPVCRSVVTGPCWAAKLLGAWDPWGSHMTANQRLHPTPSGDLIAEADSLLHAQAKALADPRLSSLLRNLCNRKITVRRACSERGVRHTQDVQCKTLLSILMKNSELRLCTTTVERRLPCGHVVKVKCKSRDDLPPPVCTMSNDRAYTFACGRHSITPASCAELQDLLNASEPRACHVDVPCHHYRCGHLITVPCHLVEATQKEEAPWGERLDRSNIAEPEEQEEPDGDNALTAAASGNSSREPEYVVQDGVQYCPVKPSVPLCQELVAYRPSCGHLMRHIPCYKAFEWTAGDSKAPSCHHPIASINSICGHDITLPCAIVQEVEGWNAWGSTNDGSSDRDDGSDDDISDGDGDDNDVKEDKVVVDNAPPPFDIRTEYIDVDGDPCDIRIILEKDVTERAPPRLPSEALLQTCRCSEEVLLERTCGHTARLPCSTIYCAEFGECSEVISHTCPVAECKAQTEVPCSKFAIGDIAPCQNMLMKLCSLCKINTVRAACCKQNVECGTSVKAKLQSCGHMVLWVCGQDDDPRATEANMRASNMGCKACALPMWSDLISRNEDSTREPAMMQTFTQAALGRLTSLVGEACIVDQTSTLIEENSYHRHLEARQRICQIKFDAMEDSKDTWHPLPTDIASESDFDSSYSLVLWVPSQKNTSASAFDAAKATRKFQNQEATPYGRGAELISLTAESLQDVLKMISGADHLLVVGVAFTLSKLKGANAFAQLKKLKGAEKKRNALQKSNQEVQSAKKRGYDSVEMKKSPHMAVYWEPGAAVPIAAFTVRKGATCKICFDSFSLNQGIQCAQGHFVCSQQGADSCFFPYARSAAEPGAIHRSRDESGNLCCPECSEAYALNHVAQQDEAAFQELLKLKLQVSTTRAVKENTAEVEARLKEEFQRIQAMVNRDERDAHLFRMEMVESVLTLKCPRAGCRAAFVDFNGCFALTCHACSCRFCGWCLKDCGADAHSHVSQCPCGQGTFADFKVFENVHRQRKERLIREKFALLPAEVKKHVMEIMRTDLEDAKITLA